QRAGRRGTAVSVVGCAHLSDMGQRSHEFEFALGRRKRAAPETYGVVVAFTSPPPRLARTLPLRPATAECAADARDAKPLRRDSWGHSGQRHRCLAGTAGPFAVR